MVQKVAKSSSESGGDKRGTAESSKDDHQEASLTLELSEVRAEILSKDEQIRRLTEELERAKKP